MCVHSWAKCEADSCCAAALSHTLSFTDSRGDKALLEYEERIDPIHQDWVKKLNPKKPLHMYLDDNELLELVDPRAPCVNYHYKWAEVNSIGQSGNYKAQEHQSTCDHVRVTYGVAL